MIFVFLLFSLSYGLTVGLKIGSTLRMSASLAFEKYQGLGNDFILVDNRHSSKPMYTQKQAVQICDRNFGVGADGLIFVLPGQSDCDYTMCIYNSDGSEPEMCGNGIRCMAKYIQKLEERLSTDVEYKIWTGAGIIAPKISREGSITVDMGVPILEVEKVPALLNPTKGKMAVASEISVLGKKYSTTAISMGNPHCVTFVDALDRMDPPFEVIGPAFESSDIFPERVNAEFVEVVSRKHLKMKVWERGAGPTLACGTGACAVLVAAVLTGQADRDCKVTLPGGDLNIHWNEKDNRIFMTGPAELSFSGIFHKIW